MQVIKRVGCKLDISVLFDKKTKIDDEWSLLYYEFIFFI